MSVIYFEWDDPAEPDGNVRHIAGHGVLPAEAEGVILSGAARSAPDPLREAVRIVDGPAGRRLLRVIVRKIGANSFRVLTAFDLEGEARRGYLVWRRRRSR